MKNTIEVKCSNGFTLRAQDQILTIVTKRAEESIPVAKIQSFSLKEPRGIGMGKIVFKTAQAATGAVNVGFGVSAAIGAERAFFFGSAEIDNARSLRDFINRGGDVPKPETPPAPPSAPSVSKDQETKGKTVVSVVDEIRGLKGLLDEGILTQEEFDAKKKQLLGL